MIVPQSPKIDAATREGLEWCRASWTPFTRLESFVRRLYRDPKWSRDEIEDVKINIQWSLLDKADRGQNW